MKRILALMFARNKEFIRDKGSLAWSFGFPIFLVLGISLAFQDPQTLFKVAVLGDTIQLEPSIKEIIELPQVTVIEAKNKDKAMLRLQQHDYHLYIEPTSKSYWINTESVEGSFLEKVFPEDSGYQRNELEAKKLRYIDWLLPGIIAINMMYGALYGVGYVIVRYRKNGYLKRLQATPVTSFEFLSSQLLSRLVISQSVMILLFAGCYFVLRPPVIGSYLLLFILSLCGAIALAGLGLMLASRVQSEELSRGLLEMFAWPMLILSEAWFSLDSAHAALQWISKCLPLTYLIRGWREVMYYDAGFADIQFECLFLIIFGLITLSIGAYLFKWHSTS